MLRVDVRKQRGEFTLDAAFGAAAPGITALFGRSGCGKSTLISLVAGLLAPDDGRVLLGDDVLVDTTRGVSVDARHRRIGVVFQDARLFPHLDVLGNLRYGARRVPKDTPVRHGEDEVIALLGLGPLAKRRPHQLSGGEKQRVALGRALLARPRLLLMDEPLASLDLARREEVFPYLEKLRDQFSVPIVYVSHQFEEVLRLATHVVLLDDGRVVADGDVATVSRDARLRAIVGADAVGAVLLGEVTRVEPSGLARLRIGDAELAVEAAAVREGQHLHVQVLARDVIIATEQPRGLSVRNVVPARIRALTPDSARAVLVELEIGHAATLLARITERASEELALKAGLHVWALVKAVSLRGHVFSAPPR